MTDRRALIHGIFLCLAPLVVAWFGLSVPTTIVLVLLLLLWRWLIVMSGFRFPEKTPDLVLETIPVSHFVEKVRWCMDRLGIDYTEKPVGGTLGAFYRGRTVPQLKARTGAVRSVIGNSTEILRYLWGRYGYSDPDAAAFLKPTNERVELEQGLNRHGVDLQIWVYYRTLGERELLLRLWGVDDPAVPVWQRQLLRLLFPVQAALIRRAFGISDQRFATSVANIEEFLGDMNERLQGDRESILDDEAPNYTDFAFAAMAGVWLMPEGYGGGRANYVRPEREQLPEPMRMDVESWKAAFPQVVDFVRSTYRRHR